MVSIWAVPTVHKMGFFLLYSVCAGASVVSMYASACQSQDTCSVDRIRPLGGPLASVCLRACVRASILSPTDVFCLSVHLIRSRGSKNVLGST